MKGVDEGAVFALIIYGWVLLVLIVTGVVLVVSR